MRAIALESNNKILEKDIAYRHSVSHPTVSHVINDAYRAYKEKTNFLTMYLCFDEFKYVKAASGAMFFIFFDADKKPVLPLKTND